MAQYRLTKPPYDSVAGLAEAPWPPDADACAASRASHGRVHLLMVDTYVSESGRVKGLPSRSPRTGRASAGAGTSSER